jgi:hypothetical protein
MSMKRSKTTASPSRDHRCGQKPPREEHEIFSDLAALCASPGFAHAIAFFCYRDNLVRYGKALQPDDLAHLNSRSGLIRAEISTLIGLLARQSIDYTLHEPAVIQGYLDQAQALLHELHRALSSLWFKGLDPETFKAEGPKLLSAAPRCANQSSMAATQHTAFNIANSPKRSMGTTGIGYWRIRDSVSLPLWSSRTHCAMCWSNS